jgi:hypothetical protein
MLLSRLAAGAIVSEILGVKAIDHSRETAPAGERHKNVKQRIFAEIASIGGIFPVLGTIDLIGPDDFVVQAEFTGQPDRHFALAARHRGAVTGNGQSLIAENRLSLPGKVGTIDSAAESDQHGSHFTQQDLQTLLLFFHLHCRYHKQNP